MRNKPQSVTEEEPPVQASDTVGDTKLLIKMSTLSILQGNSLTKRVVVLRGTHVGSERALSILKITTLIMMTV